MGTLEGTRVAASPRMEAYFQGLHAEAERVLAIARQARAKGLDPSLSVEIPLAADLAARVEEQVQIPGVAARIRELSRQHSSRELVALHCAKEVAAGKFQAWGSREQALDKSVRTGLSILTEGILVAPLEGIAKVEIGSNPDGSEFVDLYFAGPIRAAGGTAQAMSVLIADVVRRDLGIGRYHPSQGEVERLKEEVPAYKRAQHLQWTPSSDEIEHLVRHCPVCINGEGTEEEEVTGHRDLPRVETNRLRGGAVLVLAEGLAQKAAKIMKLVSSLKIPDWDFLERFAKKPSDPAPQGEPGEITEIEASDKFIKELIGGRPVLAHPSRIGGFRLRYGRARTAGIAATAIHPIAMRAADDFLAFGTQMKIERPGKGTICTPCGGIEPPILLLRNGDLVQPQTVEAFQQVRLLVQSITDLGEILIPFGEFSENNAILADASFTREWWLAELAAVAGPDLAAAWSERTPSFEEALQVSREHGVPLHPDHNLFWHDLAWPDFVALSEHVANRASVDGDALRIVASPQAKRALVNLGALHRETPEGYVVAERWKALAWGLGTRVEDGRLVSLPERANCLEAPPQTRFPIVSAASLLTGVTIKPRAPTRIGARMGRPEKADKRQMDPPVHVLFPVGHEGGAQRAIDEAAHKGAVRAKVGIRRCSACGREAYLVRCRCGARTEPTGAQAQERDLPVKEEYALALSRLQLAKPPKRLKGVQGLVSEPKIPEPLEKGILRANHDVWVFKDGTIRFDATDAPLTHFRPAEIGTSVERLRALGYDADARGAPLERPDQVVELRVQDVVLPERAGDYFVRVAQYIDDLLQRFYGLPPFYQVQQPRDLVGHLIAGLAPHTSGAVLGRVIGFTKAQVGLAHPFFHTAKRRNCVAGETELFVFNSSVPTRKSLEDLWASTHGPEVRKDAHGTVAKEVRGLNVYSLNRTTGKAEVKPVLRIYRSPMPRHLVEVRTRAGRRLVCTPDHPLILASANGTMPRAAVQAKRAPLAVPIGLPFESEPIPDIDLVEAFLARPEPWMTFRNVGAWLKAWIAKRGGLRDAATAIGIRKKFLDQYRRRDSVPVEFVRRILALEGWDARSIPADAKVAALRDTVNLARVVRWTPEVMRFLGYYAAEGHSRKRAGSLFQVSIACTESEIRADVEACAAAAFGLRPHKSRFALTFSSRVLHHLITEILGAGHNSHAKRVPPAVAAQPLPLTREFLRAYFAGDGHVGKSAALVSCTSVSLGLLWDIGHQLSLRGINYKIETHDRPAGGAVKDFLLRKGRPLRNFVIHVLSMGSEHVRNFGSQIGVALARKQIRLDVRKGEKGVSRLPKAFGGLLADSIESVEPQPARSGFVYDLEVEENHTFLTVGNFPGKNCDGDEDAFMLLLDAFLNFSRSFIPDRRGGLMDLPLVLATRIDPNEIDKEAHNLDVGWRYPLEFYRATETHQNAKNVAARLDLVGARLGTPAQYEGFGYTVETPSLHDGPVESAYKTLGTMPEKMAAQLALADKIRAVDASDVAARVISHHLLPDLIGNLKAFAKQSVRCTKCNAKYRRIPIAGKCTRQVGAGKDLCGNPLTLTVHQASVRKYMDLCIRLSEKYDIPEYTREHIRLVEKYIDDSFRMRETKLAAFA